MSRTIRKPKRRGVGVEKPPAGPRLVRVLVPLLLFVGGAAAVVIGIEFVGWDNLVFVSKVPPQLVGRWDIQGGESDGGGLEFFRNGRMIGQIKLLGELRPVEAMVRVEGDSLYLTTRQPSTGQEDVRIHKIKHLDERSLVLEDPRGISMRMTRE